MEAALCVPRCMPDPWLNKLSALAPLTAEERHALAGAATRTVVVRAGQDIVAEGRPVDACHVLLDGFAVRYKLLPQGRRQIVHFGLPGDALDLDAMITGRLDHAVGAVRRCHVAVLPHGALHDLSGRHPGIARAFRCESVLDSAISREWVVNVGRRSSYQRIAHLLCETFTRLRATGHASDEGERAFDWPLSQSELGDATGLSTVHVNRMLQQLRAERLIGPRSDLITILDWPGLQRAGTFDPGYLIQDWRQARGSGAAESIVRAEAPDGSHTRRERPCPGRVG